MLITARFEGKTRTCHENSIRLIEPGCIAFQGEADSHRLTAREYDDIMKQVEYSRLFSRCALRQK